MCVLLVETDFLNRMVMAEELRDAGFEVMEAGTGDEAVELIRKQPMVFTALVTDVVLPGRPDGTGVAALMRKNWPAIPVVLASSRPDILGPQWGQGFGYSMLQKPFMPSRLIETVSTLTGEGRGLL